VVAVAWSAFTTARRISSWLIRHAEGPDIGASTPKTPPPPPEGSARRRALQAIAMVSPRHSQQVVVSPGADWTRGKSASSARRTAGPSDNSSRQVVWVAARFRCPNPA
jgi:hypothetical protein